MAFNELSDEEWARLETLTGDEPAAGLGRRGRPRVEARDVVNAVLWILTTREPWANLPACYPSGPTCRRRVAAWRASGTLGEIVLLLSQIGRTFPSGSQAALTWATKVNPLVEDCDLRDDGRARVVWRQSWQSSSRAAYKAQALDPISCMARQLIIADGESPDHAAENTARLSDSQLGRMSHDLLRRGGQIVEVGGYTVCAGAEQLPSGMFRAWAEVMKERRRLERSGLIGPRFESADLARHHALEWARSWIDCRRDVREADACALDESVAFPELMMSTWPEPENAATTSVPERFSVAAECFSGSRVNLKSGARFVACLVDRTRGAYGATAGRVAGRLDVVASKTIKTKTAMNSTIRGSSK